MTLLSWQQGLVTVIYSKVKLAMNYNIGLTAKILFINFLFSLLFRV